MNARLTSILSAALLAFTGVSLALVANGAPASGAGRRTFDTKGCKDIPMVKFSLEVPKGWTVQESLRDQFQLILHFTATEAGATNHVEFVVKKADEAQGKKWLQQKDVFTTQLTATDGLRDGFKTRRVTAVDKGDTAKRVSINLLAKAPWFFSVTGGGKGQQQDKFMKAADHIADSLRLEK